MRCDACNTDNPSGSTNCQSCGKSLVSAETTINFPLRKDESSGKAPVASFKGSGAHLIVVKGSHTEQEILLQDGVTVVGRDPDSSIFLNDVTVSRRHAQIQLDKNRYTLRDSGSLNGTYLNGERVDEAELKSGDEFWIGKFKMIFAVG